MQHSDMPTRRQVLISAAAFTGAAVLGTDAFGETERGSGIIETSLNSTSRPAGAPASMRPGRYRPEFVKDLTHLTNMGGKSQGAMWWEFDTYMTPNEAFFVRNEYPMTPRAETDQRLDKRFWKLKIHGDAVENEITITYDDLMRMPSRTIVATMECAGNARTLFWEQQQMTKGNTKVKGNSWGLGGIGQAEWTYVPMSHIFDLVGIKKNAKAALFWSGLDQHPNPTKPEHQQSYTGRPHPMDDLLKRPDDIGLAFKMNGVDLPPDHGAPVRALVPGWSGASSVKWISEIKIASHNFWTVLNSYKHVFAGPEFEAPKPEPGDEFRMVRPDQILGPPATWLKPKSLLTLPIVLEHTARVPANYPLEAGQLPFMVNGRQTMRGYAWGPQYGIKKVEYRIDGGPWRDARLAPPNLGKYTWVRFEFPWDAPRGTHVIETRATDDAGQRQPTNRLPFNKGGFDFWSVPRFDIEVY